MSDIAPEAIDKIVISSSEMLKPHWLKASLETGIYKRMLFFLLIHGCNVNVNKAFST